MLKLYQKIGLFIILFSFFVSANQSETKNLEVFLISPKKLLKINESVKITASIEGDTAQGYTYFWWATAGVITGSGNEIWYTAPDQKGTVEIYVEVMDEQNFIYKQSVSMLIYKQIGFLKADDIKYDPENILCPGWEKFIDYMKNRQIKACLGIVCKHLEVEDQEFISRLKEVHNSGYFEFFNHGYDHVVNGINEKGEIYSEFYNTSFEEQKEHLIKGQNLAKEKLNITLHSFGAPGNAIDDNTMKAIEEVADLKVWLYGKNESSKLVLSNWGWIESPSCNPNYKVFIQNYDPEVDCYVFQLHAWAWTDKQFDVFVKILDFLVHREVTFLTPYEYYKLTRTFYNLTVDSIPDTSVSITAIPNDINDKGDGNTNFIRTYAKNTTVTLKAPAAHKGKGFSRWIVNGVKNTNRTFQVNIDSNHTATVYYEIPLNPEIALNRTNLNFGCFTGGIFPESQAVSITNGGDGVLEWTASTMTPWLNIEPSSGTNFSIMNVSINPAGLKAGVYTGVISVTAPYTDNSPQWVNITLNVYNANLTNPPFGEFSTPISGSTVCNSIAVTGWVLDDIEVDSVKLYCGEYFIGDVVLVDGARPDVEETYPDFPNNYKAGWGYMLLTNFLPGGGNGEYTLNVFATDIEGHQVSLGSKTIMCDNAHAEKPFGAIDTPAQGGTASGSSYVNWGWVLTPQPNRVPTDGSTIKVFVDSVYIGHPTYNIYRFDIADLFPGYANSNGAVGCFYLDTTAYENGVHTIHWTAEDNAGNTDGIGSRYFTIFNSGVSSVASGQGSMVTTELIRFPVDGSPVGIIKGVNRNAVPIEGFPDENGIITIEIKELERIELYIDNNSIQVEEKGSKNSKFKIQNSKFYSGYQFVGRQLRGLPIGSTLDAQKGIFYWKPGPGFIKDYRFVFIVKGKDGELSKKNCKIKVKPKFAMD